VLFRLFRYRKGIPLSRLVISWSVPLISSNNPTHRLSSIDVLDTSIIQSRGARSIQNSTTANPRPLYHARHSRRICRRCSSKLYAQFNRDARNVVIIETRRCGRYQRSWKLDGRDSICCECTLSLSDTRHSHMYQ
jgi:hypothetical protein